MHLDLKPGNILRRLDGRPVLIDFGISKHYDKSGNATTISPAAHSPGYAAPEQYQEGGVSEFSPSTDIYSLGATLYFLMSGKRPPESTRLAWGDDELPRIDGISNRAWKTILLAMQSKRIKRPQSAAEFLGLLTDTSQPHMHGKANASRPIMKKTSQPLKAVVDDEEESTILDVVEENDEKEENTKVGIKLWRGLLILLIWVAAIIGMSTLSRTDTLDKDGKVLAYLYGIASILAFVFFYINRQRFTGKWLIVARTFSTIAFLVNTALLPIWNYSLTYAYIILSVGLALLSAITFAMEKAK